MTLNKQDFHDLVDALFDMESERTSMSDFGDSEFYMTDHIARLRRKIIWGLWDCTTMEEVNNLIKDTPREQRDKFYRHPLIYTINMLAKYTWDEIRNEKA